MRFSLLLTGLALFFAMPGTVADEGPGPQMGFAGSYDSIYYGRDVEVADGYVYVVDYGYDLFQGRMVVLDVSDPTNPTLVGSYDTSDRPKGVIVSGDYAYVVDGTGLDVVDISDPTNPTYTGSYDTVGKARDVAVSGNYAYVADSKLTSDGSTALLVLDVSDPTNPTYVAGYRNTFADSDTNTMSVVVSNNYAWIAAMSGFDVVDMSDPTKPTYAGSYNTSSYAMSVAMAGDYAYLGTEDDGLFVAERKEDWMVTAMYNSENGILNTCCKGVAVGGGYAYVIDGNTEHDGYGRLLVLGLDSDGDTIVDVADSFPSNPDEWTDSDGDGVGDNSDAFPNDLTTSLDSDGDGYPDSWNSGITSSTLYLDRFPSDPTEWRDTDADGVGDNGDQFPDNSHEWADTDSDGTGDNSDVFPNDPDEQFDTDGDGVGDNSDTFPETALFKSWWGPGFIIFITIMGSILLLTVRTNQGILAEADQILEELENKGGDNAYLIIAPARSLIDEAQKRVWDQPLAEKARDKAEQISSKHSKVQEEINVVDKMLKGFDKNGMNVKEAFEVLEHAQNTLSEGKFIKAREHLENAKEIGSKLKEEYGESMEKIDQIKAKIAEFKEKGVNTDELEKILKKAERKVKK